MRVSCRRAMKKVMPQGFVEVMAELDDPRLTSKRLLQLEEWCQRGFRDATGEPVILLPEEDADVTELILQLRRKLVRHPSLPRQLLFRLMPGFPQALDNPALPLLFLDRQPTKDELGTMVVTLRWQLQRRFFKEGWKDLFRAWRKHHGLSLDELQVAFPALPNHTSDRRLWEMDAMIRLLGTVPQTLGHRAFPGVVRMCLAIDAERQKQQGDRWEPLHGTLFLRGLMANQHERSSARLRRRLRTRARIAQQEQMAYVVRLAKRQAGDGWRVTRTQGDDTFVEG